VQFEIGNPKFESLKDNCYIMTAGEPLKGTQIISSLKAHLSEKRDMTIDEIVAKLSREYQNLRKKVIEERVLLTRGFTTDQFYQRFNTLPEWFARTIDQELLEEPFDLEFLVFGIENDRAHIYTVSEKGDVDCYDSIGFAAIGSGRAQALAEIARYPYSSTSSLGQALNLVYFAKKEAQRVAGVGAETDLGIMYITTEEDIAIWRADKEFLDLLDHEYDKLHSYHTAIHEETTKLIEDRIYKRDEKPKDKEHEVV
jgi:hypothetical protein